MKFCEILSVRVKLFHADRWTDGHDEASSSYSLRESANIFVTISSSVFRSSAI